MFVHKFGAEILRVASEGKFVLPTRAISRCFTLRNAHERSVLRKETLPRGRKITPRKLREGELPWEGESPLEPSPQHSALSPFEIVLRFNRNEVCPARRIAR